ncbi:MAG: ABC transporter ATP-binding protein [Bacillaceae bacterium]|nr:ABC transporter ATP-binding protein [Bacillaceae bacterium]
MLEIHSLVKRFDDIEAVKNVSFQVKKGETYGLVGESGSGKSTIGNMIIGLLQPTSGDILMEGKHLWDKSSYKRMKNGEIQIVFQDPQSSLDPRMTIRSILLEPLRALPLKERREKGKKSNLGKLLRTVGMNESHLDRHPHEFSGGQRQRIAIARAIITDPVFIILDEPTSALDVSVQAQILNLLKKLQKERGLTYLFISHDMSVIQYMCDRVGVLYHGELVEENKTSKLFSSPQKDYTKKLLSSLPTLFEKEDQYA